ncbi:MAG: fused DSP-PTPase phosphatase/NAD kinase-like protein [Polyangiales bacterium]
MFKHSQLVAFLALAVGWFGSPLLASADGTPDKPNAPKQIESKPPLVSIPNAKVTKDGLLVGGQPSPEQLKAIRDAGYQTVINLRTESETGDEGEQALVERLGMKFVSIPVAGPAGLTEANARTLGKALAERDALPAVVHCVSGQRVSALLGLKAFVVDRLSAAAAIDLAKSLGLTKLESALRQRIAEICKSDKSRNCEGLQ